MYTLFKVRGICSETLILSNKIIDVIKSLMEIQTQTYHISKKINKCLLFQADLLIYSKRDIFFIGVYRVIYIGDMT